MPLETTTKFINRHLISIAPETTPGVDPGTGYVLIPFNSGASTKIEGDKIELDIINSAFTKIGHAVVGKRYKFSGEINFIPGGVDQVGNIIPPDCDPLLKASGLTREILFVISSENLSGTFQLGEMLQVGLSDVGILYSIDISGTDAKLWILKDSGAPVLNIGDTLTGVDSSATTDIKTDADSIIEGLIYLPDSNKESHGSVTIIDNIDGTRKIATYCRGNIKFTFKVADTLRLSFEFTGIYHVPTTESLIDANFSENEPIICNPSLLGIGDLDTSIVAIEMLELDLGNEVSPINDIKADDAITAVFITDRNSTGSVNPTTVALSDWNPWQIWQQHQRQKIYISVGNGGVGNRLRLEIPQAQFDVPDDSGERNKVQVTNIPFQATGRTTFWQDNDVAILIF